MAHYYKGKKSFSEHLKQLLWHMIYPIFVPTQTVLLRLGIIHHSGRQPFHIGHLAPNYTKEAFIERLHKQDFHRHFVAWHDQGQLISMRRHVSFEFQYHIRLFDDKEIRGHYEMTPEGHPFDHFLEKGMVAANEAFKNYLGAMLVEDASGQTTSQRAPEASTTSPYNGK